MPKVRIIAHYMHETEALAAAPYIRQAESTDSYVMGEVEEKDIEALRKHGLIVQVIDDQSDIESAEDAAGAGVRSPTARAPVPGVPGYYTIRLNGPVLESWRGEMEKLGAFLLQRTSGYRFTVRLDPAQAQKIGALSFVRSVRPFDEGSPAAAGTSPSPTRAARPPRPYNSPAAASAARAAEVLTFDARLHRPEDLGAVKAALEARGVKLAGASGRKVRFYLIADATLDRELQAVVDIPEIAHVERYVPPRLHNDLARVLLGVDPRPIPVSAFRRPGHGEIVAVADTGLDDTHADFQGRIDHIVASGPARRFERPARPRHPRRRVGARRRRRRRPEGSGDRARRRGSTSSHCSMPTAGSGGLPLDLGTCSTRRIRRARASTTTVGARWCAPSTRMNSLEVDEFVATHRDMLMVISAGNEGRPPTGVNSQAGFVDWLSIGAPASSKNALTVGASRSEPARRAGMRRSRMAAHGPPTFRTRRSRTAGSPGTAEGLAGFSSRGPCTDRRIKPDVVAPGHRHRFGKSSHGSAAALLGPGAGQPELRLHGRHQHGGAAGGRVRGAGARVLRTRTAATSRARRCSRRH